IPSGRLPRFVTDSSFFSGGGGGGPPPGPLPNPPAMVRGEQSSPAPPRVRAVVMLALACAPVVAGCRTGRGHDGPDYPAAKGWFAGDAVHTQTELGNGVRVVVEEHPLAAL